MCIQLLILLVTARLAQSSSCNAKDKNCDTVSKFAHVPRPRPESIFEWNITHVDNWLFDVCRAPDRVRKAVVSWTELYSLLHKTTAGTSLARMTPSTLREILEPLDYAYHTTRIFDELKLRQVAPEFYFVEAAQDALNDTQIKGLALLFGLTEEEARASFGVADPPYPWPYNGIFSAMNTAIIVVDMQIDFMVKGGYMNIVNPSWSPDLDIINPVAEALEALRSMNFHIVHTREGHAEDVKDLPSNKYWRSRGDGYYYVNGEKREQPGIGDPYFIDWLFENGTRTQIPTRLLTRGQFGWNIIGTDDLDPYVPFNDPSLKWAQVTPLPNEAVVDKPTKGSFANTELDLHLRTRKIQNIILAGVTTDVCVSTIMREANDLGYECILLTDATASAKKWVREAIIKSVQMSNGIFGSTIDSAGFLKGMERYKKLLDDQQAKQHVGYKSHHAHL